MSDPFRVRDDEPAVRSPVLEALARQARGQAVPALRVDADAVRAVWRERRAARRRWVAYAVAAAVVLAVAWSAMFRDRRSAPAAVQSDPASVAVAPSGGGAAESVAGPPEVVAPAPLETPEGVQPALASTVRFEPKDATQAQFTIVGAWEVTVSAGVYAIGVDSAADRSLTITVQRHVLEVDPGGAITLVAGDRPQATLERGTAAWVDSAGRRTALGDTAAKPSAKRSAAALARDADAFMSAGKHREATAVLTTLVRKHPRTSAGKAALLDLARLLRTTGRKDRARCAYGLYLKRWPGTPLRSEVERALGALGDGPACRGLRPL